jgi:beta-xylosidase
LLHRSSVARSKSPEGPWEPAPNNPILYNDNNDNGNLTVQSTGHGTFVETPDNKTYIVFLARRNVNGASPLGRETFIASVEWEAGWPVVNGGRPILLSDEIPGLPDKVSTPQEQTDNFAGSSLDKSWYTLRMAYTEIYTLDAEQGGLIFAPNVFNLSDRDVPAAILRKQKSLNMTFSALTIPLPELAPGRL